MEIEQKETDCKCKNSIGWTTIKCCNQCGKSIEPFWRVDSENKTQPIIGIEQKEREIVYGYFYNEQGDYTITRNDEAIAWVRGEKTAKLITTSANKDILYLQKEVVQPMQSVMIAAAEEIMRVWPAHCDAEGYGPTNLMHRLEKGIPSQYGYTAGAFAKLEAENKALREQVDQLTYEIKEAIEKNEG